MLEAKKVKNVTKHVSEKQTGKIAEKKDLPEDRAVVPLERLG